MSYPRIKSHFRRRWERRLRQWIDLAFIFWLTITNPKMASEVLGYAKVEVLRKRRLLVASETPPVPEK
jgi:hypothetical protein